MYLSLRYPELFALRHAKPERGGSVEDVTTACLSVERCVSHMGILGFMVRLGRGGEVGAWKQTPKQKLSASQPLTYTNLMFSIFNRNCSLKSS